MTDGRHENAYTVGRLQSKDGPRKSKESKNRRGSPVTCIDVPNHESTSTSKTETSAKERQVAPTERDKKSRSLSFELTTYTNAHREGINQNGSFFSIDLLQWCVLVSSLQYPFHSFIHSFFLFRSHTPFS